MRRFNLVRTEDVHGSSGVGVVAEGVAFSDFQGPVAMRWLGLGDTPQSIVVFYECGIRDVRAIHGHEGRTEIVWLDPDEATH